MAKYIESKLNPDGVTYDHTEVIEICHSGAEIEFSFGNGHFEHWLNVRDTPERRAKWVKDVKYRAQVPDTYGIHESSSTLREIKGDAGPAVAEMLLDRIKELEHVLTDIIRDHDDPLEPGTTQYFWDQARAALNKE